MTEPSTDDIERVYGYLVEYITAKKYPPSRAEIAQAMRLATGDRRRTRQHSRRGTFLPSHEVQIDAALEALHRAGKLRLCQPSKRGRLDIRLATRTTEQTTGLATAGTTPTMPARRRLTPGPIICMQCSNPVCEESKCLCALHLQRAREAGNAHYMRKRLAMGKTVQQGKGWQNRRAAPPLIGLA